MAEHVVYVDRFEIRDGRFVDLRRYADEDGGRGTAVFVFADADAFDVHLDVIGSWLQEGYELLRAAEIELPGNASPRAVQLARCSTRASSGGLPASAGSR